jgi:hypothetical protein
MLEAGVGRVWIVINFNLERVWDFLTKSKTAHLRLFFIFFQSRSPGYATEKR